jgi:uncharacterized protein YdeI (YjbR/CyaY-like superfamily)
MSNKQISKGVVHTSPTDLKKAINSNPKILELWNNLTPLARNEWICWTISVKKEETRKEYIERLCNDLIKGKKRPCCWPGCKHR